MNILIIGLGLIGGSYAEGLKRKNHTIFGYDTDETVMAKAIASGLIKNQSLEKSIQMCDCVILALYPMDNIHFVKRYHHLFHENQLITDVSGTKEDLINAMEKMLPNKIRYTSHHPMAGKETKGFEYRDHHMFKGANFMIVKTKLSTDKDIEMLKSIARDLEFKHQIVVDAKTHDELIAFTSQLTHVLAVSLVNSDEKEETKYATGDSYRDLTRIAKINEKLWAELFIENKTALLHSIHQFEVTLNELKTFIQNGDIENIEQALLRAKKKRGSFDVY